MSTLNVATVKSLNTLPPAVQNSSGTEIGTFCRAWVNFNGTGTVAIRASFNVTSITDNGTGDYTVNFTTAMADTNYCAALSGGEGTAGSGGRVPASSGSTTTTFRIQVRNLDNAAADSTDTYVAIFR